MSRTSYTVYATLPRSTGLGFRFGMGLVLYGFRGAGLGARSGLG